MIPEAEIDRNLAADNASSTAAAPSEETQVPEYSQGAQPGFSASRSR